MAHQNTKDFADNNYLACYTVSLYPWRSLGQHKTEIKTIAETDLHGKRLPVSSNPQVAPPYNL